MNTRRNLKRYKALIKLMRRSHFSPVTALVKSYGRINPVVQIPDFPIRAYTSHKVVIPNCSLSELIYFTMPIRIPTVKTIYQFLSIRSATFAFKSPATKIPARSSSYPEPGKPGKEMQIMKTGSIGTGSIGTGGIARLACYIFTAPVCPRTAIHSARYRAIIVNKQQRIVSGISI